MGNSTLQFPELVIMACSDDRLTRTQLSLYLGVLNCWYNQEGAKEIKITRKKLMELSKIAAISTYHRNLKSLIGLGYITYCPTFNYYLKSRISLNQISQIGNKVASTFFG